MVAEKLPDWLPSGWTVQVKVKNGRKVTYYSNVETGQKFSSKKDFIRYVKLGNVRRGTPRKMSEHNTRRSKNKPMPIVVKTNESPAWLPHGWIMELKTRKRGLKIGASYQCYIDPATGCKFYSKPEVSRYLKTIKQNSSTAKEKKKITSLKIDSSTGGKSSSKKDVSHNSKIIKGKSCASVQKKIGFCKHSTNNVVVERLSPDELPPGWIKETKTRKSVNGIKKDPYYTDPVSGYIFRSKKDALRYLETGDIDSCAIKPKKRDSNDLELINDETSSPSAADGKKLRHHTTRRRLFEGKESSDTSSVAAPEAASSKKRRRNSLSSDGKITSTPTAEILEEKDSLANVNEKCAETKESSDPKTKGSKRRRGMIVFAESGSVFTPETDILQEQKLPENGMERHSNKKTQIDSSKSKNKRALSLPARSSKRLAGLKPEILADLGFSERALRAAARKSGEIEANPSSGLALEAAAHGAPQQHEAEPGMEIANHASVGKEAPSDTEPSNKSQKPLEDQAVSEEQPERQGTEKQDHEKPESQDSQLFCPFGDSWSDPCLEFAFKTLTGAIPVEDNLAINGYFHQQLDTSHTKKDDCVALPEFGFPSFFQNDVSSHFDAPEKHVSMQQLPANPTFLPPGNVSLPSCSGTAPQQSSLEAGNKECGTKVN